MKRIITSAGLVVLGAAGAQAVGYAPGFASTDMTKPWSVGLTMSGFYDSNPLTYSTGNPGLISSWGYNLSPYVSGAYSTDQTQIGARYTFGMDYYANYPNNNTDYSHIFTLFANHQFNERYALNFANNFVYSQEPEVLGLGGSPDVPFRTQQNNMANNANITFTSALSERMNLVLGYNNRYLDYEQSPSDATTPSNPNGVGSLQALLNRVENSVLANLEYKVNPQAMVLGGFQYGQIDYIGDGAIGYDASGDVLMSESRNSRNYYIYAGGSYAFNPDLSVSLKVGGQYSDSYNINTSDWSPYVDLSGQWRFSPRGSLQVGFTESFSQTYVLAANATTMVPYLNASYGITEKLTLSGLAKVAMSDFNGGAYDGQSYNLWMMGINASYALNRHLSFDVGYNYDNNDSDSAAVWSYTRSKVYFGVTARY